MLWQLYLKVISKRKQQAIRDTIHQLVLYLQILAYLSLRQCISSNNKRKIDDSKDISISKQKSKKLTDALGELCNTNCFSCNSVKIKINYL